MTRVARLHVGPVGEEGDVAKPLGLALGQQESGVVRAGKVQAFQRGVRRRAQAHAGFQHAAVAGTIDLQHVARVTIGGGGQRFAIEHDRQQLQVLAVQPQRCVLRGVAAQQQARAQLAGVDAEVEIQLDRFHPPGGRAVVAESDQGGGLLGKCAW